MKSRGYNVVFSIPYDLMFDLKVRRFIHANSLNLAPFSSVPNPRRYWARKSRRGRRPKIDTELRWLIRRVRRENLTWGAPRIHGELLKLGYDVSEATVSNYMRRYRKPPSQSWRTFLTIHRKAIAAIDFFTVPTITFDELYVFVVIEHARRGVVHFNVTAHPTSKWIAQIAGDWIHSKHEQSLSSLSHTNM